MPNPRLAGRYAKSLLDLAIEKKQLGEVYDDMLLLKKVFKTSREFLLLLSSPIIKPDKKEKILAAITKDKLSVMTATFNKLLVQKGRESYLPEIVDAFITQYKTYKNIHIVKLTTAVPLNDALKNAIEKKIKTECNLEQVELVTIVNEGIIGGFVIELGDMLVNASIEYDLHNIKMQFLRNDFEFKLR
jgi:F-type H+-transporting ATPase subunit delta